MTPGFSSRDAGSWWVWVSFAALAILYLAHAVLRVAAGEAYQRDEAEQLVLAQEWHWGYGSQGPLYTWLLRVMPGSDGPGVVQLAVLKNLLLFGTHVFVFLLGRRVLGGEVPALVASLALFLIPGFVYESQRDQTHLVLASCLGAATAWGLIRVVMDRRPGDYMLLGLFAAGAILAKYNTLVFLFGMAMAVALDPWARGAFRSRWAWVGFGVCLLTLAPHMVWAWENPELLSSQAHKLGRGAVPDPIRARVLAVGRWILAVAAYAPVPLACLLVLRHGRRRSSATAGSLLPGDSPSARLVAGGLGLTLVLAAAAAVAMGTVSLKSRWFQPVMVVLPVITLWIVRRHWNTAGLSRMALLSTAAALLGGGAVHGTIWGAGWLRRPHNLNIPYEVVAAELREEGFDRGLLLSDDWRLAGSLSQEFDACVALVPTLSFFRVPRGQHAVIVWNASKGEAMPESLRRLAEPWVSDWPCHEPSGVAVVRGKRGDPGVTRLAYLVIPKSRS